MPYKGTLPEEGSRIRHQNVLHLYQLKNGQSPQKVMSNFCNQLECYSSPVTVSQKTKWFLNISVTTAPDSHVYKPFIFTMSLVTDA